MNNTVFVACSFGVTISHPIAVCRTLAGAQQACRDFAAKPLTAFDGISATGDESIWRAEPEDELMDFDNGYFIYLMTVSE